MKEILAIHFYKTLTSLSRIAFCVVRISSSCTKVFHSKWHTTALSSCRISTLSDFVAPHTLPNSGKNWFIVYFCCICIEVWIVTNWSILMAASGKSMVEVSWKNLHQNPIFSGLLKWALLLPKRQMNWISQLAGVVFRESEQQPGVDSPALHCVDCQRKGENASSIMWIS